MSNSGCVRIEALEQPNPQLPPEQMMEAAQFNLLQRRSLGVHMLRDRNLELPLSKRTMWRRADRRQMATASSVCLLARWGSVLVKS